MRALPLLATLLLTLASGLRAQDETDSGPGLLGLDLPLGARVVGMGRAAAAAAGDIQAVPYNPATLAGIGRGALAFSRYEATDEAGFNSNYVAAGASTRWGVLAAHLVYLDYGTITLTTGSPDAVGSIEVSEWTAGVTYANTWREKLSFGATAKWYASDLGVVDGSGPAFDAGLLYEPRSTVPIAFALSVRNVGPAIDFESSADGDPEADADEGQRLPGRVRVGVAFHPTRFIGLPPDYAVTLAFDIESDVEELSTSSQHAGASILVKDVVVLRGGIVLADNPYIESGDGDRNTGGTFGVGVRFGDFEADVAREVSVSELGDETHFSVGWRF